MCSGTPRPNSISERFTFTNIFQRCLSCVWEESHLVVVSVGVGAVVSLGSFLLIGEALAVPLPGSEPLPRAEVGVWGLSPRP